ncbi:MAG: TetR/AcrR family transcriptional regulator [Verrucomicrobia bacterium]|nr:TetR/AcrR family transcriptional regulator [Verrucomicrobiota bacterium]
MKTTASRRAEKTAARRQAILDAALTEFSDKGFAATRMEDVARRAGVAKGTIYLHFEHKEALFEGLLRQVIVPVVENFKAIEPQPDEPAPAFAERLVQPIAEGFREGRFAAVVHLFIAEGPRFPQLAKMYYQLVVEVGMTAVRTLAARAQARGELTGDALVQFPQLLIAPLLVGLLWRSLFDRFGSLDAHGMVQAQLDLLFHAPEPDKPAKFRKD